MFLFAGLLAIGRMRGQAGPGNTPADAVDRSPVDLALSPDERWLYTANQTSHSLSIVEAGTGRIVSEVPVGKRPTSLALSRDGRRLAITGTWSGDVTIFDVDGGTLKKSGQVHVGFEPRGIAMSADGKLAYVAQTSAHQVAVLDLDRAKMVDSIAVKRWPRYLALSPDGKRLAVGTSGDGGVSVVDPAAGKMVFTEEFAGINLGEMQISKDSQSVYFPWMVYRHNPITQNNVRIGWVLASRFARVKLDNATRRDALSLDIQGAAVADPHGIALSPDEETVVVSASGTHELLVMRLPDMPMLDYGGTDHLPDDLRKDKKRFDRIPLGGRPMAVRYAKDGQRVFVANYLDNSVQVVNIPARKIVQTIRLGGPKEPSLARKGEAIFLDGQRSFDQWYSCHSCHYEGHTNAVAMDTKNDGRFGNFKTVLSLRNVTQTGPYFWHGWEKDLASAIKRSMIETMLGKTPTVDDVKAVQAYLDTLEPPPNPHRSSEGKHSAAAQRGESIFRGEKANCVRCHSGKYFTDGRTHDVRTGERGDVYKGYNPPSLLGIFDRTQYLHDGRAKSLDDLLRGPHSPARVTGKGDLSDAELHDLIEYVKSL